MFITNFLFFISRLAVGSSAKSILGFFINALASASLCFSPRREMIHYY
ncbi:hypothetical protein FORC69_p140 (plasmid) [Escherichia coli]|nr:hypothetical protein FORC69_p140 [Escherichia coli]